MALKVSTTSRIPPFLAMEMMNATRDLEAGGADLVHLEIGQPSTPPPPAVLQALSKSLGTTQTHGYSVAFGEMPCVGALQRITGIGMAIVPILPILP